MRVAVVVSSLIFGLIHFDWGVMGIMQTTFMRTLKIETGERRSVTKRRRFKLAYFIPQPVQLTPFFLSGTSLVLELSHRSRPHL